MTDRQNAKLNMHQKALNVCGEHKKKYAGIPAFVNTVAGIFTLYGNVNTVARKNKNH